MMVMEYNFWADALSKYYASIPVIQALIVLTLSATIVGVVCCICYAVRAFSPYQPHHLQPVTLEGAIAMVDTASGILLSIRKDPHYKLTDERHALFAQGRDAAHQLHCLFDYAERKQIERSKCVSTNSDK